MKSSSSKNNNTSFSLIRLIRDINLKKIFRLHAIFCMLLGSILFVMPRKLFSSVITSTSYDHFSHEYIRLYGVLNFAIGWLIWKLRDLTDGRIGQAIAESFAVCYFFQFIVMFRAQFSNPLGHSLMHWLIAIKFGILAYSYIYIRFFKKIKYFELPGSHDK